MQFFSLYYRVLLFAILLKYYIVCMTIQDMIDWIQKIYRTTIYQQRKKYPKLYDFTQKSERSVLLFFFTLLFILFIRLGSIQIVQNNTYEDKLSINHNTSTNIKAKRWHIYIQDRSQWYLQLTENITLYNVFVDPKFVPNKDRLITILTPLIYVHLCQKNWFTQPDKAQCIRNIESFGGKNILPQAPEIMYYGSGRISSGYNEFDWTGHNNNYQEIIKAFTKEQAKKTIAEKLDSTIRIWERKYNYIGYFTDPILLQSITLLNRPYIHLFYNHYLFIEPRALWSLSSSKAYKELAWLLSARGFDINSYNLENKFQPREYRYVKLMSDVHPSIIDVLNTLKTTYYKDQTKWIPLLHGVGVESYNRRYYPYQEFMSHIIGYLGKDTIPHFGIEEYFDDILRWVDGRLEGRSSASIGQIGANDFTIKNVENWYDVYLTIDPVIQKQVEIIINKYREKFRADSISVLIYDPRSGHVIASANAPFYNANHVNDIYMLQSLQPEQSYLVDDLTYLDFPIYIQTWWETRLATSYERSDPSLPKYVTKNPLWPNLFVDKNIAFPYEPWSIFKTFTYGIGLDLQEIDAYDYYDDPLSEIKVWPYTIKNAEKMACIGTHTFLYALQHSCNVGMVRISQKLTKNTFYNYLEKLWFWAMTNVELAGEDPWFVESINSVSVARYFNNVFGQWLLATPIQIAAAYGALVNWGQYIKPTILSKICESWTTTCQQNKTKFIKQIFNPEISEKIRFALTKVISIPVNGKYSDVPGYNVWWKSWTSQISYKWRYRSGNWWTNWSYVGIITEDNMKYITVIQVRRPRSTQWGNQTAGPIFKDIASFLINYETLNWAKFTGKKTDTDYSNYDWAQSLD